MLGSLTIVLKNGKRYGANGLTTLRKGWGDAGESDAYEQMVLAFEHAGILMSVDLQDVESIELNTWPSAGAMGMANAGTAPTNISVHYGTQVRSKP